MNLCDLPDDILRLVLQQPLAGHGAQVQSIRARLPLAAVCRRWRRLVLPVVHGAVFIRYNVGWGGEGVKVATNLGLVVSAGCVQRVRQVEISANRLGAILPAVESVTETLRQAAGEWRGVRSLDLTLYPDNQSLGDGYNAPEGVDNPRVQAVCDALAAMMPGVSRLLLSWSAYRRTLAELQGRLASAYAGQLRHLDMGHPVAVPRDVVFRQLRTMGAECRRGIDHWLPRADPAELAVLDLQGWPADRAWSAFAADDASREIRFPRLRMLKVSDHGRSAADESAARLREAHTWRLHFPALELLHIETDHGTCLDLDRAVLPSHMSAIVIDAGPAVLRSIADVPLPAVRRFELKISSDGAHDATVLPAAARLLSNVHAADQMQLFVYDDLVPVVPEAIAGAPLTQLVVSAPTSVDTLVELATQLPSLASLTARNLTVDNIQADISIPGPDDGRLVAPLSTKIQSMSVGLYCGSRFSEELTEVAMYLVLAMPTLTSLSARQVSIDRILAHVDAYSGRYPHLESLVIEDI